MNEQVETIDDRMQPEESRGLTDKLMQIPARIGANDMTADDIDRAQLAIKDDLSLPPHFRTRVATMVTCIQLARHWGMVPVMVAQQTAVINGKLSYMSQLLHGVVNKCAPLQHRLRIEFGRQVRKEIDGEMQTVWIKDELAPDNLRQCRVWSKFKDDDFEYEYVSPPFDKIQPKNSSQWKTDPNQQHSYRSMNAWARRHCPEVLMGCYSKEEAEDTPNFGFENAKEVNGKLAERIAASNFTPEAEHPVEAELVSAGHKAPAPVKAQDEIKPPRKKPGPKPKARPAPEPAHDVATGEIFEQALVDEMRETVAEVVERLPELRTEPEPHPEPEPEPEPEADVAPEPEPEDELKVDPNPAPRAPRDKEEYRLHMIAWLAEMQTQKAIRERWNAERDLRTKLGYPDNASRQTLIDEVNLRFKQVPAE